MLCKSLRLVVLLTIVLVHVCQAQSQAPAKHLTKPPSRMDGAGASDRCYRNLTNSGPLVAYSVTVPPHGSTLVHPHPQDYLLLALKKADLKLSGTYGNAFELHLADGGIQVVNGGWAHRVSNLDDSGALFIEIDVQGGIRPERASCGLAASDCTDMTFGKTDEGTYTRSTLFETPTVKLTRVSLGPGGVLEQHTHAGSDVLVSLTSAHLADDDGGVTPRVLDLDAGEVRSFPAHTAHRITNAGSKQVQFLEFERK